MCMHCEPGESFEERTPRTHEKGSVGLGVVTRMSMRKSFIRTPMDPGTMVEQVASDGNAGN